MKISINVQERIKELMSKRGWSHYRLAKEANLSQSTVSNMFCRNNSPTLPTLEAVCNAFNITLAEFFLNDSDNLLTDEQQLLLEKWGKLTLEQRHHFLALMNAIIETK